MRRFFRGILELQKRWRKTKYYWPTIIQDINIFIILYNISCQLVKNPTDKNQG